jgi:hypothetical protein
MAPQSSALLLESGLDACITSLSERQLVAASSAFTGPYVQIDCQVQKISFEFHKRGSSPKSFREGALRQPALAFRSWYGTSVERTSRCCSADAGDSAQDRNCSPFPRSIRENSPVHGFGFFLLLATIVLLNRWSGCGRALMRRCFTAAVYKRHLRCVAGIYGGLGSKTELMMRERN